MSEQIWRADFNLDAKAVEFLVTNRDTLPAVAMEQARLLRNLDVEIITGQSATYPHRIESYDDDMPPILYTRGALPLLTPTPRAFTFTSAISRGHTREALERQEQVANRLIALGGTPVTGHDRPAYQRLALAAQRQRRPSIFVLDRGLLEAMGPSCSLPLFAAARIRDAVFAHERDLAVSPFRLNDHCVGGNNVRRDRLIIALSQVIVAVDVSHEGGMLEHCRKAISCGIPVFVDIRGRAGCKMLADEGGICLEENQDAMANQVLTRLGATI